MEQWQKELKEQGYTHLKGVVPPEMIAAARADIDRLRARDSNNLDSKGCDSIHNLVRKPPMENYVETALGWDNLAWYQDAGQIAIVPARNADTPWQLGAHIDGFFEPGDDCVPFSMLVGVYLSTTPGPFAGNFCVWPGSHLKHEKYFRDRGPDAMKGGQPRLYYDHSVQLVVQAGDAVIAHYLCAHGTAGNMSDVDRIAVYFRICAKGDRWQQLTNLWHSWKF
ncbi:MAG TPA: phytanoyl-CoA dioxygenase family protein [Planctomycetota bacterium]|nr:phytanoyl-CoA dioxygenase family protein [Planctomycetota bacterium]